MKDFPIYIHLYFNPKEVEQFKDGEITFLFGYTKEVKSNTDTLHLSIPLGKVSKEQPEGEYLLNRDYFAEEF